jgi:hypothetical protein
VLERLVEQDVVEVCWLGQHNASIGSAREPHEPICWAILMAARCSVARRLSTSALAVHSSA